MPAVERGEDILVDFSDVVSAPHGFLSALLATPIGCMGMKAYKRIKIINAAAEIRETVEATAKLELCSITRQKWSRKRSLHSVNEHFEAIFNAVRERKVSFAYSSVDFILDENTG
uniref:Uncharacterized protein n=1 Tax=Candidatus Kentrum sp. DK TaxID=2126562 RepID=A0A450RWL1_9GAMM|nr:MAG: hypothetical protein BECKDK2373C_GA0170839_100548 [Candidatus Kentron sp. DK]VFJ52875.1 MAG: hypothetical protein BECKDK2373B_GA0170837_10405 [Candidatus Kentron sp. DK]